MTTALLQKEPDSCPQCNLGQTGHGGHNEGLGMTPNQLANMPATYAYSFVESVLGSKSMPTIASPRLVLVSASFLGSL